MKAQATIKIEIGNKIFSASTDLNIAQYLTKKEAVEMIEEDGMDFYNESVYESLNTVFSDSYKITKHQYDGTILSAVVKCSKCSKGFEMVIAIDPRKDLNMTDQECSDLDELEDDMWNDVIEEAIVDGMDVVAN